MPKSSRNLVWMDLEMSGLDPEKDVILEIATIVTDLNLNILQEDDFPKVQASLSSSYSL